jgi:hypothetical protein
MRLRIATCARLPEPDPDQEPLLDALRAAGIDARLRAWDGADVDWDAPEATVLRSTWNYYRDVDRFLAWAARAARSGPLYNGLPAVRWNAHKRYLDELRTAGFPIVPTRFIGRGETPDLGAVVRAERWDRFVVKPAVSAASYETRLYRRDETAEADAHVARLGPAVDMMVQPYVASVESHGERSVIAIDGEVTHAVRKAPRLCSEDEAVGGRLDVAGDERALAHAILDRLPFDLLYARLDVVRDERGSPMVMELELIEPSLYLVQEPRAMERLVQGLARRLSAG